MPQARPATVPLLLRASRRLRWIAHPITIFVGLQLVWLALILMWIIWFVGQQESISELAKRVGQDYFDSSTVVAMLVVGCVLLSVLLVGTIMLFVFGQRQSNAVRQQRSFVSSVTHELKSPLASLQLAFETLIAHKLSEEQNHRLMEMIHTDIERLKRLVDQILVAGRLDRGIEPNADDQQDFLVRELIERIAERLSYLDPKLKGRLTIDCPERLTLRASRSTMVLILNNLMENAIKYSPRDAAIDITVIANEIAVELRVKDRGYGLDKRDMRRIFKMFHRSESAIKKAIPGTGLGLYIVKSSVRMLGGRVWAESPGKNQGTTFFVSLPMKGTALGGA